MGLSLLQILLLACIIYYAFSSQVNRRIDGDRILLDKCIKSCSVYNADCVDNSKCCKQCKCSSRNGKTYYRNSSTQSCVTPNSVEGCKYHLNPRTRDWINIQPGGTTRKDLLLYHREVKLFSYTCALLKQQYWNLVEWKDFKTKYFALDKDTDYKIKVPVKNTSYFAGELIKLRIKCNTNSDVEESCIIFKILGNKKYPTSITEPVVPTTTQRPTTTTVQRQTKTKTSSTIIIVIIAVTTLILVAIGIFVVWWCWKKRRKAGHGENSLLNYGEDPNYQNTDRFSVRHSTEIHNSANNLTYLQPVDAGVPYNSKKSKHQDKNGKKKKKKDHNYDYPDVHSLSQKSAGYQLPRDDISKVEKPIYAEVGDIKPNPDYTDPDTIIKPRTGTAVVGVPGYQPFRGPHTEDSKSEYSSLGVLSSDDTSVYQALLDDPTQPKPSTPQYAVVEADERKAVENTDDDEVGDIII